MSSHKNLSSIAVTILTIFSLLFIGCSSTTSDSDSDSDSSNGGDTPSESFNSPTVNPDGTYSYTFENAGDFEYYCNIHAPDMQGKITVSSSAEAVARDTVIMQGMSFNPTNLTVAPNTEVVWVNEASTDHTVYSGNPSSDGGSGDGPGY